MRRAVALAWSEQARGLDPEGPTASEAAAEIVWRERGRALERLSAPLERLSALAVEAGVVSPRSTALLRAPLEVWFDHAGTLGVADVRSGSDVVGPFRRAESAPSTPEVGDPLSGVDLALAAHDEVETVEEPTLDAALGLAQRVLREVSAPSAAVHPSVRVSDASPEPRV